MSGPRSGRTRMRRAAACLVAAVALLAGACGGSDDEPRTYRVGIDIPFHPLFAYVQANQREYFEGKPYNVELRVMDTQTLVPSFAKGDLDVIATFPSFLPRIEQRHGIVAQEFLPLARIDDGMAVWVPKDSPARQLTDLRGKDVATPPLGQQWGEDEAMVVAATGRTIREMFEVRESAAPVQQLLLGRVAGAFVGGEAVAQVAKSRRFRPLVSSDEIFARAYGDPLVLSGGFASDREFLEDNRQFADDLKAAFDDAWRKYAADSRRVATVASRESGLSVEQLLGFGDAIGLDTVAEKHRRITRQDVRTWRRIYQALADSGFLEQAPAEPARYFLVDR